MPKTLADINKHVLDPETGLPALPDGYFWRVRDANYKGHAYIELRSRYFIRHWLFWKKEASSKIHDELVLSPITRPRILREAHDVIDAVQANLVSDYSLIGDYPPKSLYT